MDLVLYGIGAAVLIIALLVARGMWLIGQGTDAEMQAREKTSGTVGTTGWSFLDALQSGNLPIVSWLESKLGLADDDNTEVQGVPQSQLRPCPDCGSRKALREQRPACPDCGGDCLRDGGSE